MNYEALKRSAWLTDLAAFGGHAGAHRPALRCAVSMGVPLLAVWELGRVDLALFAAVGAFTAVFGRAERGWQRLRVQAGVGLMLVASVVLPS